MFYIHPCSPSPRQLNSLCRTALSLGLARAARLTSLQLRSKCTDPLLQTVAGACPLLKELNISLSEQVTILAPLLLSPR